VTLAPQDIVRKEFREAFRGYNQAEVDLFLDEVVEEFGRLADDNQKMKVRLAALQQEVARLREGGGTVAGGDAKSVEDEVRARVRRFLEEQIKLVDAAGKAKRSATVERIAREVPQAPDQPAEPGDAEPFWAGE
jgi:cell division initiation protein